MADIERGSSEDDELEAEDSDEHVDAYQCEFCHHVYEDFDAVRPFSLSPLLPHADPAPVCAGQAGPPGGFPERFLARAERSTDMCSALSSLDYSSRSHLSIIQPRVPVIMVSAWNSSPFSVYSAVSMRKHASFGREGYTKDRTLMMSRSG